MKRANALDGQLNCQQSPLLAVSGLVVLFLFCGCRNTVEFIPQSDGRYRIVTNGRMTASFKDGKVEATIDTKGQSSIVRTAVEGAAVQGLRK